MTRENSRSETAPRETAGSHMVNHIPRTTADTPVNSVIRSLQGQRFDCADTVFVIDGEGRLEGIVRINDLLANSERPIGEIMEPQHEAVRAGDDQEEIAVLAIQLSMIVVPVVDNDERLIGAVPPEALFRILRAEHMEDLQRLAGIAPHARGPAVALRAPLFDRFPRRLRWLVVGLFASSITTFVMVGFEQSLLANVAVAFFVPALVYITGAIGTQAVSVAVQGLLTENISIKALLRDELAIGIAIGASLGLISSMLVFDHFDFDPALGSGPICTIVQDVSSLLIYFVLVGTLVL